MRAEWEWTGMDRDGRNGREGQAGRGARKSGEFMVVDTPQVSAVLVGLDGDRRGSGADAHGEFDELDDSGDMHAAGGDECKRRKDKRADHIADEGSLNTKLWECDSDGNAAGC